MGGVKDFFSGNNNKVEGTGQTVGELKDSGFTKDQIAQMGPVKVSPWQKMAKGGLMGGAGAMQQMGTPAQGGGAVPIQGEQAQLPGDFFQPSTYLLDARKRFDPFYGG